MFVSQRMTDDRKEYFIKKNKILEEFKMGSIRNQIAKIFEEKQGRSNVI